MSFAEKNGLRYFQFEIFQGHPIFQAVLTRRGGYSSPPFDSLNTGGTVGDNGMDMLENHKKIYKTFGYDFFSRFDVWQVNGRKVVCADGPRDPDTPHAKADGILTQNPDVTLFMRFADCVPILLFDPVAGVIGIIHAGWRGTVQQIAREAVGKMAACYGSQPADILAGIGPSICQKCYQVGPEVREAFRQSFGAQSHRYFRRRRGAWQLDLWAANRDNLRNAGVQNIEVARICTACHPDDWFSHRAEGGRTGRFAAMMALRSV